MKQWGQGGISDQLDMEKVCFVQSGFLIWLNVQLLFADTAKHRVQRVEIGHKRGSTRAVEGWAAPWWFQLRLKPRSKKVLVF